VLAFLYELVDFSTGRLEPAIATIAHTIAQVVLCRTRRALPIADTGFLQWVRRSRLIENPVPGGTAELPLVLKAVAWQSAAGTAAKFQLLLFRLDTATRATRQLE
jgi:hypothetical protein